MFAKAMKGSYAIPAYNFNNMEQMQAIIQACVKQNLLLFYKFLQAPENMQTKRFYATWHRVLLNMQRAWL